MKQIMKNYGFSIILISASILGAIAGLVFGKRTVAVQPIADIFLNLVFVLIVPIVFFSIADAIANMDSRGKLRKILMLFITIVVVGGVITSLLALIVINLISVAPSGAIQLGKSTAIAANFNVVSMLTVPDFYNLLSKNNMLPLIIFTIATGIAINALGKVGQPAKQVIHSISEVCMKLVSYVMKLAPIGIGCYFAALVGKMGGQVISSIAQLALVYVGFTILFFLITNPAMAYYGGGRTGLKAYFTNIWTPMATAMGTCSSAACIPVNIVASEKMHIPTEIPNIIMPLGGSINKNGVVSVQIMKIAFLFAMFHRTFDLKNMAMAVVVAVISGVIVGTIPSGGFIGEMFICSAFGFPTAVVPIIVIMGTLTDPFCTMNNVTSNPATAMVLARIVDGKNWIKEKVAGETVSAANTEN